MSLAVAGPCEPDLLNEVAKPRRIKKIDALPIMIAEIFKNRYYCSGKRPSPLIINRAVQIYVIHEK